MLLAVRPKITDLHFHLYAQAVHPELFSSCAQRVIEREAYRLELNITTDGHAIRIQSQQLHFTEISAGLHHPLPEHGCLLSHPILLQPQRSELEVAPGILYHTSVQRESVDPKMFVALQQQLDQKVECQGLVHRFGSNGRLSFGAISYIHAQSFQRNVLIRSFHTFPESATVIRSETRFRLA